MLRTIYLSGLFKIIDEKDEEGDVELV